MCDKCKHWLVLNYIASLFNERGLQHQIPDWGWGSRDRISGGQNYCRIY
jgi:hypothetical protein